MWIASQDYLDTDTLVISSYFNVDLSLPPRALADSEIQGQITGFIEESQWWLPVFAIKRGTCMP